MNSNKKIARIAGVLYLIYIIMFASSTFMPQNIFAQEELFRIRNAMELISTVFFLSAAWALYVLLKPVNKNFALLFVLLNLVGVAAECVCILIRLCSSYSDTWGRIFEGALTRAITGSFYANAQY